MRSTLPVLLALSACGPDSVDEACKNHVAGQSGSSEEETAVFSRITCYRKYVGLDQARINDRVSEAAAGHAEYLEQNQTLTSDPYNWPYENAGQPGYLGETSFDRLDATQYFVEGVTDTAFVWEILMSLDSVQADGDPDEVYAAIIDAYMIDPFFRDAFLAPAWDGGGYGEGTDPTWGTFGYMNIVLYFPSGARSSRPVVYPQDGQQDVPTTWIRSFEDPMIDLPFQVGFPITFTHGSSTLGAGTNPLDVSVDSSSISGPSGDVEHTILLPGPYASGINWSTAILVPVEPLEPNSEYTVEAELSWINRDKRTEKLTFHTGDGT
jgi:hypothetical protein